MKRHGYEKIPEIKQHEISQTIAVCGVAGSDGEALIQNLSTRGYQSLTDTAGNCTIHVTFEKRRIESEELAEPNARQLVHTDQVLLTFNVNDLASLDALNHYAELITQHAPNALVTLVGTQDDQLGSVSSITKAVANGITRKDVTVEDSDIDAFIKKHGCQCCIKVSEHENKGIAELQQHLIESSKEQYLLNKIAELRTLAQDPSLSTHAHLNSIATLLYAGINSEDPAAFFEKDKVKESLDAHLKALRSSSSSMCSTATNVILTSLSWLPAGIPRGLMSWCGTLDKNYKATGSHNMFSQSGHKQQAEKTILDVREHAQHKGRGKQ